MAGQILEFFNSFLTNFLRISQSNIGSSTLYEFSNSSEFIISEEVKDRGDHDDWTGPIVLAKEIDETKWEKLNLFNYGIVKNKPASTGITILRKK